MTRSDAATSGRRQQPPLLALVPRERRKPVLLVTNVGNSIARTGRLTVHRQQHLFVRGDVCVDLRTDCRSGCPQGAIHAGTSNLQLDEPFDAREWLQREQGAGPCAAEALSPSGPLGG